MCLKLIDHKSPLQVVVRYLEFQNLAKRITDDGNDEVHENHEQEENREQPYKPRKLHDRLAVAVLLRFIVRIHIDQQIKSKVHVDHREIAHSAPEDREYVRQQLVHSAVGRDVYAHEMEADRECQQVHREHHQEEQD